MPTQKARTLPMPEQQSVLIDTIGNEVYSSHYAERKAYRLILGCGTVLLLASMGLDLMLATRPVRDRYIRIDAMGKAQAIQYSDLNYTPREGEVRTYLMDWANYRYTINKDTIATKYPLNYYFLSQALASHLMQQDSADHLVSQVTSGQLEADEAQVTNVIITSMTTQTIHDATIARGTALINVDKTYASATSHQPRIEHWVISVTYYLNPQQVSEMSQVYPQFETINPLGLTITQFDDNRVSVQPLKVDESQPASTEAPR